MTGTGLRVATTLLAGLLTTATVAGCGDAADAEPNGVATMDPAEALLAAQRATGELADATYSGTSTLETTAGRKQVSTTLLIRSDGRCASSSESEEVGSVTIRAIDRTVYVTADARAMRVYLGYDAARVRQLRGKWLKLVVPPDRSVGCSLEDLLPGSGRHGTFAAAGEGEIGGTPVRRFEGEDDQGNPITIAIALEGEPIVLGVSGRDAKGHYSYELAESDAGAEVSAPPRRRVVSAG